MWLALIMAFNVWFIIWPNQKKALGPGRGRRCDQGQGGAHRDAGEPDQHLAVDPDALRDDQLPLTLRAALIGGAVRFRSSAGGPCTAAVRSSARPSSGRAAARAAGRHRRHEHCRCPHRPWRARNRPAPACAVPVRAPSSTMRQRIDAVAEAGMDDRLVQPGFGLRRVESPARHRNRLRHASHRCAAR